MYAFVYATIFFVIFRNCWFWRCRCVSARVHKYSKLALVLSVGCWRNRIYSIEWQAVKTMFIILPLRIDDIHLIDSTGIQFPSMLHTENQITSCIYAFWLASSRQLAVETVCNMHPYGHCIVHIIIHQSKMDFFASLLLCIAISFRKMFELLEICCSLLNKSRSFISIGFQSWS